jgi:geranylgeranyl pyrophosphate synthase
MHTPEPGDDQIAEVIELVSAAGGLEYAGGRAAALGALAEAELDRLRPTGARESLRATIPYVLERRR